MENKYFVKKIQMINYKVFDDTTLHFNDSELVIFDGPNGYGKTSVFEAIEYAFTGTILRIEDTSSVNGSKGYDENPIAKDTSKEVEIKLCLGTDSGDNNIEILRKIPKTSGNENNPKKIFAQTKSTLIINGEVYNGGFDEKLTEIFKIDLKKHYRSIYYIPQEDKLKFLAGGSNDRKSVIDYLLNINGVKTELEHFEKLKTTLNKKAKELEPQIEELPKNTDVDNEHTEYIDLLGDVTHKPLWDLVTHKVSSKEQLNEDLAELEMVYNLKKQIIMNNDWNRKVDQIKNSWTRVASAYIINQKGGFDQYETDKKKHEKIQLESKNDLTIRDYEKFKEIPNLETHIESIKELVEKYNIIKSCANSFDQNLSNLKEKRIEFIDLSKKENYISDNETICYNCGYDWKEKEKYEQAVMSFEEKLNQISSEHSQKLSDTKAEIEKLYNENIAKTVEAYLNNYKYIEDIKSLGAVINKTEYYKIQNDKIIEVIKQVIPENEIAENIILQELSSIIMERAEQTRKETHENIDELSTIFKKIYGNDIDKIVEISEEDYSKKRLYLQQKYNEYLKQNSEEIFKNNEKYNSQIVIINKSVEQITEVITCYKKTINQYYNKILASIKIPVFIYTGRVLQNYKGGLGIHIESVEYKSGGLSEIRFTTEHAKSHDILYTLSSGQLSGFIMAFTLVLNKAYGSPGIKSILIDDPVQTMDDINVVSLTDILRNDFRDYQLIISTHEEKFSKFIEYKYSKFDLNCQRVNMLGLEMKKEMQE